MRRVTDDPVHGLPCKGVQMTRREIAFLCFGVASGAAATLAAWAQSGTPSVMGSNVFTWDSHPVEKTANGERRAIFDSATATVDRLESHVTSLDVGKASHAAHQHSDEELVFVREGVIEATINGVARLAPAGSVIFFAAKDLHGMRNAGDTPASYFVLRWTSPGREGPKPGGSR
jgi:mannose-6-phosphate isomerase-like protein (cupin superfamily)